MRALDCKLFFAGATWPYDLNLKNKTVGFPKESYKQDPALTGFAALTAGLPRGVFDVCNDMEGDMIISEGDVFALPQKWKLVVQQEVHVIKVFRKDIVRASGPAKLFSDGWGTIGQCQDFLCDSSRIDRYGAIIGFGAHVPLFLKLYPLSDDAAKKEQQPRSEGASGSGGASGGGWSGGGGGDSGARASGPGPGTKRQRSDVGRELRTTKYEKFQEWKRTGVWPWHLAYHPSEATYFAPKNFKLRGKLHQGGGYDGVAWRLTRAFYIKNGKEAELDEYERKWKETYGDEAHQMALSFTEPFFALAEQSGHTVHQVLHDREIREKYKEMAVNLDVVDYDVNPLGTRASASWQ